MGWNFYTAFAVVMAIMFLGELVSLKSRGRIPSLLIIAICFLAGYWTVFPRDILDISMVNSVRTITMAVILLQVGAMFSLREFLQEWRTVVITLLSVLGIMVIAGIGGCLIFGSNAALVAIPPLTGGGMATIIMSDAAESLGLAELAMMSTIIYIMQGFVGFPLTGFMLRRAGIKLLNDFRNGTASLVKEEKKAEKASNTKKKLVDRIPDRYKTPSYYLAKLSVLAVLVALVSQISGINASLVMIVTGVLAAHFGLLEKDPLKKANSFGILMLCLTASFMRYFADATPQQVFSLIIPVVVFLALATCGIMLFSIPLGKKFGYPLELSIAIGLNCFLGFPHNFVITNEVIGSLAENPKETEYLNEIMMPKMIIGSVIAVSMVSAVIAGVLVPYLAV
ncbi:MAG: hypothetical protein ACLTKI_03670 [Lachnospiraceae bacterium]